METALLFLCCPKQPMAGRHTFNTSMISANQMEQQFSLYQGHLFPVTNGPGYVVVRSLKLQYVWKVKTVIWCSGVTKRGCNRCSCPGRHFFGGGIFGHQCPENVDPQLFKINIWLNFLQRRKRMLLGCNNHHKCSFNVFPLTEGVRATGGDLIC